MAHISLPEGVAGIVGPMMAFPETAQHLNALAEALLRGPSSLSIAERETIAAHVSAGNECYFCTNCHAAAARHLLGDERGLVDAVIADRATAPVTEKLLALLEIASKVRVDGRSVAPDEVVRARAAGADDKAIHDTVLVAAAFCMFNRYVDGLATWAPRDAGMYEKIGEKLATRGYLTSVPVKV